MKLFVTEPEVAGEIGERTVFENYDAIVSSGARPIVAYLHFVFMGWLGDDIIETTPCFLVSERLKNAIEQSDLSGYEFQDAEISISEEFEELYPKTQLPQFYRLIPQGSINVIGESYADWSGMDFCITEKAYLVLSEKAVNLIKGFNSDNADFTEIFPQ